MPFFIILMLSVICMAGFYVGSRILSGIHLVFPNLPGYIFWTVFMLMVLMIPLSYMISETPAKRALSVYAGIAMGALLYSFLIAAVLDIIRLLLKLFRVYPAFMQTGRAAMIVCLAAALAVTGLVTYGTVHARSLKLKSYDITSSHFASIPSLKIAVASDFHLGSVIGKKRVRAAVDMINAQSPDLVILTGDIFDGNYSAVKNPGEIAAIFREINSVYGVYAVLGNHDAGKTYDEMVDFFPGAGVTLLQDEAVVADDKFVIVGRRDISPIGSASDEKRKTAAELIDDFINMDLPLGLPRIVIDHQPSAIDEAKQLGALLMVSGHTHKGQVFPGNLLTAAMYDNSYGCKKFDSMYSVVTSGAGTWGPPMRIASDSEVVIINLAFAEDD